MKLKEAIRSKKVGSRIWVRPSTTGEINHSCSAIPIDWGHKAESNAIVRKYVVYGGQA